MYSLPHVEYPRLSCLGLNPWRERVASSRRAGYLAGMVRSRLAEEFDIEVEGELYVWRLQRRPHWAKNAAERRGMAVAVRHLEGQREAVVEFPPGPQPKFKAPALKAAQIDPRLVARAIACTIAAGWDPHSRGRAVDIVLDEADVADLG
jgi:hypothetical protein